MKLNFLFFILFISVFSQAQEKITLEHLWKDYTFYGQRLPGFRFMNDGQNFIKKEQNKIVKLNLVDNKSTGILFDGDQVKNENFDGRFDSFILSEDESHILLLTDKKSIYRRSYSCNFLVWDGTQISPLYNKAKQNLAAFSPDNKKVAFVSENNLFVKDLASGKVDQITEDGKFNHIINGTTDWVYEEEFGYTKAFEWSSDSKKIAFIRFDESKVKEFSMNYYNDGAYPDQYTFKYPKVGEDNAKLQVKIYNIESKSTMIPEIGDTEYIPKMRWSNNPNQLCVFKMNRHQNDLEIVLVNAKNGVVKTMYHETNKAYINIPFCFEFIGDNQYLISSEQSGYNHIYLYNTNGKKIKQITKGKYEVHSFYGYDKLRKNIYYQASKESPLKREIYEINLKGKKERKLSKKDGFNTAQFSKTFDYYVVTHTNSTTPNNANIYDNKGNLVREVLNNDYQKEIANKFGFSPTEYTSIKTSQGHEIYGFIIKPHNFDPKKKYPVLMYLYGGPGHQAVLDKWSVDNKGWFQMLAQNGYMVACFDNIGTDGRGQDFAKKTYMQMGKYELEDQLDAAKYLGDLPYVDKERIGIFGWSYGGYMSSLCIFKGHDVFKSAIAVAPVTNWKWYDSIYTERYMRTVEENRDGYFNNSPVNFANQLEGNYLIVHGVGDDNVHFQNSVEMVNRLIDANKQFDSFYYPNRNHSIYGGNTRLHLFQLLTNFVFEKI